MFRLVRNLYGGGFQVTPPLDNQPYQMKDATAARAGMMAWYETNTEKLIPVVNDKLPGILVTDTAAADTPGAKVRGMYLVPGMIFRAPITIKNGGDATTSNFHANFKVGFKGVQINDLGTGVDCVTAPSTGKLVLLEIDSENMIATVALACTVLAHNIADG